VSDVEEIAKAVQKVSDLGVQAIETSEKVGGFFAQVFKEPIAEFAGILTDRLRFVRLTRLVEMQSQVNEILSSKNISDTRSVPPKFALPLLQEASLEDDTDLQRLWSRLLANAMDPKFVGDLRIGFLEMIKGLTAQDAQILEFFYGVLKRENRLAPLERVIHYSLKKEQIMQALAISEADYQVSVFNLMRIQCIAPAVLKTTGISFGDEPTTIYKGIDAVTLTPLGIKFAQACME
jgi:Abortive infection alpha